MMKSLQVVSIISLIVIMAFNSFILGNDKIKPQMQKELIFEDKGIRHHMVLMNDKITGKKVIVDTLQHCEVDDISSVNSVDPTVLGNYIIAGDTLCQWYWLAADSGEVLAIQAAFFTAGNGSWNIYGAHEPDGILVPNTPDFKLAFDVPWTVTADTVGAGDGLWNGHWQTYDLEANFLSVTVESGFYVGYYPDATGNPLALMDDIFEHVLPITDGWNVPRFWMQDAWYWLSYGGQVYWREMIQRIVVRYDKVAPVIVGLTSFQDYFDGNPELDIAAKTVSATISDLDGTVASANLRFTVTGTTDTSTVSMTNTSGNTWEADFGVTFSGGDEIEYWVESEDNEANVSISASLTFDVVTPPSGIDVLIVAESAGGGEIAFETALLNLSKTYYTWDMGVHGGISSYEINYGFNVVLWTGFGTGRAPDPYGADATGVSTFMDNGGNLIITDMDYLWVHGWPATDTLAAGDFGYDYLGLYIGESDPTLGDTVYYGQSGDPISSSFLPGSDSITVSPIAGGGSDDWSDGTIARPEAYNTFYSSTSMDSGYYAGVFYQGATFTSLFLPWSLETAPGAQIETVLGNFFTLTAIDDSEGSAVATTYQLAQNYPNPFNPTTQISFSLKIAGNTELTVYNALGQKVITLINNEMTAGAHNVQWNGLDANGKAVATGVYIYKLKSGDFSSTRKMLLIK